MNKAELGSPDEKFCAVEDGRAYRIGGGSKRLSPMRWQTRRGENPAGLFVLVRLTEFGRRELQRRLMGIGKFEAALSSGLSGREAAREAGIPRTTLDRWFAGNLIPLTSLRGRKSILKTFGVTSDHVRTVKRLQLLCDAGNSDAWRLFQSHPDCPPALAKYLRRAKTVSASLLAASRLTPRQRKAVLLEGRMYQAIVRE